MPLTILTDSNVKDLLDNLTVEDVESLQASMRQALHKYSTGNQNDEACSMHQPVGTLLASEKHGTNTLFMPSKGSEGIGMKVVTLRDLPDHDPKSSGTHTQGALTLMTPIGQPFGFINACETTAFRTALASSLLISRRGKIHTITCFGAGKQAYWHIRLCLLLRGSTIRHINIIARELNMRAKMLMKSFLHILSEVKAREGWTNAKFGVLTPMYGEFERMSKDQIRAADVIFCTTPSTEPLFDEKILTNTEGRRKGRLVVAVGSYRPHMIEIPPEILVQATKVHGSGHHFHKHAEEGRVVVVDTMSGCLAEAGEVIQAGLTDKQLVELGEIALLELLPHEEEPEESPTPTSPNSSIEGLNIHDNRPALTSVFGRENSVDSEMSRSVSPSRSSSFSIGSLSRKGSGIFHHKRTGSMSSISSKNGRDKEEDAMQRWLRSGNVIYKSVGMGLMDLVVGTELVEMANERGVGTRVRDF